MTHPDVYHKTRGAKHNLAAIFGEGLLAVEGEKHRIQRRVMVCLMIFLSFLLADNP